MSAAWPLQKGESRNDKTTACCHPQRPAGLWPAAVGAVANAVLDKPMRGIGAKTYRVTGPWASPKVETISHAASAQVEAEQTRSDPARDEQGHVD